MPLDRFFDWLSHKSATPNTVLRLVPEPEAPGFAEPGYFQLRLSEMRLTDERRWAREIVPAVFVNTDFNYGAQQARRPFMVSNGLLSSLPGNIDGRSIRVNFRDTLLLGPTPYAGGDVSLFVGLFQMTIGDRLGAALSILETLFGAAMPGPMAAQIKLAGQLAREIEACLGDKELKCLLADQSVIGQHAIPHAGYHVYLKGEVPASRQSSMAVHEGRLVYKNGAGMEAVGDYDYALVKVEHQMLRNDYASLPFHAIFEQARQQLVFGKSEESRLLMLECIGSIYASLDLSEEDKVRLIAFYQARLLAMQTQHRSLATTRATTGASAITLMRKRVLESSPLDGRKLDGSLDVVDTLLNQFARQELSPDKPVSADDVQAFMQSADAPRPHAVKAETLVTALAAGSFAA